MASEYAPIDTRAASRPMRTLLIVALIAFLVGLVAMGFALREWGHRLTFLSPQAPAAQTPPPAAQAAPQLRAYPVDPATADQLAIRVRDLEERLSRISVSAQAASGNAARAEGLLVAFAARRALDRGVALGYIEAQLRDRFGPAQPRAVAVVIGAARQPVTLEGLKVELARLAPELATQGSTANWWEGARRELGELIVIRRAGTPSPAPVERLARARLQLDGGQVDTALAEVARMPGRAKAENWMASARRYIEARRALDIIETAAILEPREAQTPLIVPAG